MQKQAIIMDCGSGYSKLGYAGNVQVSPSSCAGSLMLPQTANCRAERQTLKGVGLACLQPSFIIPTVLAPSGGSKPPRGLEDLGFCAGKCCCLAALDVPQDVLALAPSAAHGRTRTNALQH